MSAHSMDPNTNQPMSEDEISIDFGKLLRNLWSKKWSILIIASLFGLLTALYTLTQVNEYSVSVKLLPEMDAKSGGLSSSGLSSLAGLAGINLGSGGTSTEAIRPDLYPMVLQSVPFLDASLQHQVFVSQKNNYSSIEELFGKNRIEAKIDLGGNESEDKLAEIKRIQIPKDQQHQALVNLDSKKDALVLNLKSRISAEIDKKTGVISLNVKLPDPVAAADWATFAQNYLIQYVTKYRTEKAKKELEFLSLRKQEAQVRYDKALYTLSSYKDQNRNLYLNVAKDKEKRLSQEVDLAYNLLNSLSAQYADAQVKVQRETPVIKILEPVQIPLKKSEPKRAIISLGGFVFGLLIGLIWVVFRSGNWKEFLGVQ